MNLVATIFNDRALAEHGDQTALLCGRDHVSYAQLQAMVGRYAAALTAEGLGPGQRILLKMRDTPALIATFLGAMAIGATPIVIALRAGAKDTDTLLEESAAAMLVFDRDGGAEVLPRKGLISLDAANLATRAAGKDAALEICDVGAGTEAFWVLSSGSTGRSKGIVHGHRSLEEVSRYHRDALGMGPGSIVLCTSRLSFAYALGNGLLTPLYLGATLLLHPEWPTPASTLALIREWRPKIVFSTPSLYRAWLNAPDAEPGLFSATELVSAGEKLPAKLAGRWQQRFGRALRDSYGCSETIYFVFASMTAEQPAGTVGRLLPWASAELRPAGEADTVGPTSSSGRLFIRHPFLAMRYSDGAAAQQHRFNHGWFETGDLFERDDGGFWTHRGRDDDLIKVAGQWVNLRDVEEAVSELGEIAACAAVTIEDDDGMARVALFVVPEPTGAKDDCAERVTAHLAERLRPFQRPKWIHVVADLPRTSTGKILKRKLSELVPGRME
jgi:acyl-coenzyme A synthetase/AMP-(fatty) acid ligase